MPWSFFSEQYCLAGHPQRFWFPLPVRELRYVQLLKQSLTGSKNELHVLSGGGGYSHAFVLETASEILELDYALLYPLCLLGWEGIPWLKLHKGKRSKCTPVISPDLEATSSSLLPNFKYEPMEPERNPRKILQGTSLSDISSSLDYFFLNPKSLFPLPFRKVFLSPLSDWSRELMTSK